MTLTNVVGRDAAAQSVEPRWWGGVSAVGQWASDDGIRPEAVASFDFFGQCQRALCVCMLPPRPPVQQRAAARDPNVRIVRGLDLDVGASYERVRDQIYLSGEDFTPEERFLRPQQEQTDYRVRMNFGLSYQFGSSFNNVVDNRM
jgi:hypothetical protein